jgi:hypothetical protein
MPWVFFFSFFAVFTHLPGNLGTAYRFKDLDLKKQSRFMHQIPHLLGFVLIYSVTINPIITTPGAKPWHQIKGKHHAHN